MRAEVLSLLSLVSEEEQTSHPHPIIGIPCDVPVPKNVIVLPMTGKITKKIRVTSYVVASCAVNLSMGSRVGSKL